MPLYALDELQPRVPATGFYWLAPDSHIIGAVTLGMQTSVWFGVVIRGDNEPVDIGSRTNIQEGAMLHTDRGYPLKVGEGCTIGHHAILHGCTLGDNTLIGMGACILNGAKIGSNCLVGAHALVTEGKEYPDNCLIIGSPARTLRALDDNDVERLRLSADHYVHAWQRFASGLRKI